MIGVGWESPRVQAFAKLGTPIYAIDERQKVIRGVTGKRYGAFVTLETKLRPGVTRRRLFHARHVSRDWWRDLEDLP